ncbi:MAG: heme lyase CcmF/NrfE family subunit [Armatimonadota bacterium]|nr:heme lyase CcmF/NrfE family subunit [Armatimonadota bacterium]MDR7449584.1 heme lyase CcmF/NrfE family subunit [Armatimonadota bacterium]MDR7460213.1 heme lyase CcmF/NrfE family subunit [Armatimonadota bacterium]MDR7480300.1 heme lyase CcmF/NrfE family subunit [Armatimonadota bacterium]MDR7489136.1 heme lyase CcmF/NrfE family subunit [Armatimonadota bacterium]
MTAALGTLALLLAALGAVGGAVALLRGQAAGPPALVTLGERAAVAVFALVTAAVAALEAALLRADFSVAYVADNVSSGTPLLFRAIALWGALEGSILLWAWLHAGFTALVAWRYRGRYPATVPLALAILLGIGAFFLLLMLGPADPFAPAVPVPLDGRGLNPLLRNHPLMAVHPPFLYLGYVGLAVPYAFAMAALLSRTLRDEWAAVTRRWTMAAWVFLTTGIVLGAWWSYEVLGWGGYWAWDPVENAALLPWLAVTAFLHSAIVQERRRLLRLWNCALVILAFLLTLFGTFLTRSGILASVHAFTVSLIGPLFLLFIAAVLAFSLAVLLLRRDQVRDEGALPASLSRETLFLLNNVLLLVLVATVFLGTLFPLVVEAVVGLRVSVGAPYFNRVAAPLVLGLLVLMAAGAVLPWGAVPRGAPRRFLAPAVAGLGAGAVARAYAAGPFTSVAFGVLAFAAWAHLLEFHQGARALQSAGTPYPLALLRLFAANRRRYTGYLAHLGLVLALAGVAGSTAFRQESDHTVRPGELFAVPGALLRYEGVTLRRDPDRLALTATVLVFPARSGAEAAPRAASGGGLTAPVAVLHPAEHLYPQQRTPLPTPAVRSTWRGDLYLVLGGVARDGTAVVKVITNPLVPWIWAGGLLMGLAGVLNLLPGRR